MNDDILIQKYQQGDSNALDVLISRNLKLVYNFAFRFVKNSADASDITQDVFVKIWKHAATYKASDKSNAFVPWLLTITKNTTIDFLRKKKAISFSDMATEEQEDFGATIIDTMQESDLIAIRREDAHYAHTLIELLSDTQKDVLHLYYDDEMTFNEIANILRKSINTVKSQHRRAIEALRMHQNALRERTL